MRSIGIITFLTVPYVENISFKWSFVTLRVNRPTWIFRGAPGFSSSPLPDCNFLRGFFFEAFLAEALLTEVLDESSSLEDAELDDPDVLLCSLVSRLLFELELRLAELDEPPALDECEDDATELLRD